MLKAAGGAVNKGVGETSKFQVVTRPWAFLTRSRGLAMICRRTQHQVFRILVNILPHPPTFSQLRAIRRELRHLVAGPH